MFQTRFSQLFAPDSWFGDTDIQFEARTTLPPAHLIGNVNMVATQGDHYLLLETATGDLTLPGGTLEPHETLADALQREMLEEAGAEVSEWEVVGAWRCVSRGVPYRPHMPHPVFYRVVVMGNARIVSQPINPPDGEQIIGVYWLPLPEIVQRLNQANKAFMAQLVQFSQTIRYQSMD